MRSVIAPSVTSLACDRTELSTERNALGTCISSTFVVKQKQNVVFAEVSSVSAILIICELLL